MRNFDYHSPTRILFGAGQIASLAQLIPSASHVLITHGGASILQNGVWREIEQALVGHPLSRFAGIEASAQYATLLRAIAQARRSRCDFILAVGGGAVIDGSKFIAAALAYPGDPFDLLSGTPIRRALPLGSIAIPDTTGSEGNCHGVVSHAELQTSLGFSAPCLFPRFAILDPRTTFSLSPRQIGSGVVASFAHALLKYLDGADDNPLRDRQLEGLLLTLLEQGPLALAQPQDYGTRANLMCCASQALNGLQGPAAAPGNAVLALGHELGRLYHLDHGQSLAVLLPAWLGEPDSCPLGKLLQYAERVWSLPRGTPQQHREAAISATAGFFRSMGLCTRLSALGLDAEAIAEILAQVQRQPAATRPDLAIEACEHLLLRAL